VLSLLFLATAAAQDGDVGLYAAAPPAGSAFVRVVNAGGAALTGKVGKYATGSIAPGVASPYYAVPGGDVALALGQKSQTVQAPTGTFVTVVSGMPGKGEGVVLPDTLSQNRAKATILLYNVSSQAGIDLATSDGKVTVFTDVPPGTEVMKEVNAISIGFTVQGPSSAVTTFPTATLERGAAYSVVVYDSGGKLAATWSTNSTAPVK